MGHHPLAIAVFLAAAGVLAAGPGWAEDAYGSLRIVQPPGEATIHDNSGRLAVTVSLTPPLDTAKGHHLQLLLDGERAASGDTATFSLAGVPRGAHTLQVDVLDQDERVLLSSPPVVVYMWHASRLFPSRMPR